MKIDEVLERARDAVDISQVFGVPIERDGVTIIPVARVTGGGGGGTGTGYGFRAEPVGVYVIKDGKVSWQPAVSANKIVSQAMVVGGMAVLTAPRIIKQARKLLRSR